MEVEDEIEGLAIEATQAYYREEGGSLVGRVGWRAYAYLAVCLRLGVKRIVLLNGPSVLGWKE